MKQVRREERDELLVWSNPNAYSYFVQDMCGLSYRPFHSSLRSRAHSHTPTYGGPIGNNSFQLTTYLRDTASCLATPCSRSPSSAASSSSASCTRYLCFFQCLPSDVQNAIVSMLLPRILSVSLVSKHFYRLADNQFTWRLHVEQTWDLKNVAPVPNNFNWKLYYREKRAMSQPLNWEEISTPHHPQPRQSHATTRVGNKIIIIGGHQVIGESFQRQDDIWSFDTTTNTFEELTPASPIPAMSRHRIVTVNDIVYSFGGILQNKQKLNSIFSFDPNTLTWSELTCHGTPPLPRCDPVVVAYHSSIIVFGGSVEDLEFPSDIHVFDTQTHTWHQPPLSGTLPPSRIGCTGAIIDDTFYIYGGGAYDKLNKKYTTLYTDIWCLNLHKWEWQHVPAYGSIPTIMDFLNVFVVGHHIVIEGGWYSEPCAFDTVARRWIKMSSKFETEEGVERRREINNNDASATLIGNSVYYFGGYHNQYKHHFYRMDVGHLSFLQTK
eukprot:TRINITY_DN2764_c0_g2_i1.p1 TRINITY_DN2764_c0_g2~~TRINITY_DN2764_c0_g2_i1.p1  ORF type:complete len:494 (-),score=69.58 TRINITY_DN2764_c0_g2_i1:21-1502(-)